MPKKVSAKRIKCSSWQGAALCKMDSHCLWNQPGGPCVTRSQYKSSGVKEGLRVSKPRSTGRKPAGAGRCGELLVGDLRKEATAKNIPGRSKMGKLELCYALGYL